MPCHRFRPFAAAAALVVAGHARADDPAPRPSCTGGDHRAFDFQLGDWTLTDSAGQPGWRIRNTSILGRCAIAEDDVDVATGSRGVSTSAWDRERKACLQDWVSSAGTTLLLRDGDRFVMHGSLPHPQTGRPQRQRVTGFIGGDGKVARQLWEQSDDDGATWAAHFDARDRPTSAPLEVHLRRGIGLALGRGGLGAIHASASVASRTDRRQQDGNQRAGMRKCAHGERVIDRPGNAAAARITRRQRGLDGAQTT